MKKEDIHIRDPFILAENGTYYMFGTTGPMWNGKCTRLDAYTSTDLENFEGPFKVFEAPEGFWADQNFWAPEVHNYKGKYYMFASFYADGYHRASQILVSEKPLGPYLPLSDGPITPSDWECLDATLYVDKEDKPWVIYSHEWTQIDDGEFCAQMLSDDLKTTVSGPLTLFAASEAKWVAAHEERDGVKQYVTDGPFIYEAADGALIMTWSSMSAGGYAAGQARSENGITGPWKQIDQAVFDKDGGHGMLFRDFNGNLFFSIHRPNAGPERPVFLPMKEENGLLYVK